MSPPPTDVADLVRLHLVLVETALRDDLDDEDAVLRSAARVGRPELLAPLHILTAADSIATGPATWTPWTAALVGTLVARLDAALSPDVDGAGLFAKAEAVRAATIVALPASAEAEVAFVEHAHLRYLASRDPAEIARDARLFRELTASSAAMAHFSRSLQDPPKARTPSPSSPRIVPNCSPAWRERWHLPDSTSCRSTRTERPSTSRSTRSS